MSDSNQEKVSQSAVPASVPESAAAAAPPAAAAPAPPAEIAAADGVGRRQGLWKRAANTWDFVVRSEKDVKIRIDDRRSIGALIASIVLLLASVVMVCVSKELRLAAVAVAIFADLLWGIAALWYVALRFGTLGTLEPRQAVLCFQFAVGVGLLFAFVAVNVVLYMGFRYTY